MTLDRSRPRQLRVQVEQAIREAVQDQRLPAGATVPASRVLAAELGISRSVVVEAYSQLVAEGYLEARQGARTMVRSSGPTSRHAHLGVLADSSGGPFASGLPDPAHFPRHAWLRNYRGVLEEHPQSGFGYPHPQGNARLRASLSGYLGRVRAVRTTPEQVLVCNGFSQGLVLAARALRARGATSIAVEDPCFLLHRRLIRAVGLDPVPIPLDDHGIDVCALARTSADAVLVAPAHSYPTGAVLSAHRRTELVAWASDRGRFIIEDDYDAEFRYDRTPIGALQGLAPEHVIYGASASKLLSPGLRLGWLALPERLVEELTRAKLLDDIATETLGQLTLARFIDRGELTRHLRRVRPIYAERRARLLAALERHMPRATPTGADAGLHVYVELDADRSERSITEAASSRGLVVEGSARHWANPYTAPPALLLGYGQLPTDLVDHSIATLSQALATTQ